MRVQKGRYLAVDAVDLTVLVLELGAHVECHIAQVADHSVHLAHVLFHLVLACIIRYPLYETNIFVVLMYNRGNPRCYRKTSFAKWTTVRSLDCTPLSL